MYMSRSTRLHTLAPRRIGRVGVVALVVALAGATTGLAACGSDDEAADTATTADAADPTIAGGASDTPAAVDPASPALVDTTAAQAILAAPPAGLVVLDVRTPEEFAAGHIDGAVMIDFRSPTFAADVAELDEEAPVFVYCRSGNRSAQAVAAMVGLGFTDITELDGGVIAWEAAGLPLVTD